MNRLNAPYKTASSASCARVSLTAAACGAATIVAASEWAAWWLTTVSPRLLERMNLVLLVLLPVLGAIVSFPAVGAAALRLVGPLSRGGRGLLLGGGIAVFALVAWHSAIMCWEDMHQSLAARSLHMSAWMYSMWIPFLSGALMLRQIVALLAARYR